MIGFDGSTGGPEVVVHRRRHVPGGRPVNVMVALSDAEAEMVRAAAAKQNMAVGAWLGEIAVRAAEDTNGIPGVPGVMRLADEMRVLMLSYSESAAHRVSLRAIGNNLNQLVRHANSTGSVHAATVHVLDRIAALVDRSEELMDLFQDSTAATRVQLLAERRRAERRRKQPPPPVIADDAMDQSEWIGE